MSHYRDLCPTCSNLRVDGYGATVEGLCEMAGMKRSAGNYREAIELYEKATHLIRSKNSNRSCNCTQYITNSKISCEKDRVGKQEKWERDGLCYYCGSGIEGHNLFETKCQKCDRKRRRIECAYASWALIGFASLSCVIAVHSVFGEFSGVGAIIGGIICAGLNLRVLANVYDGTTGGGYGIAKSIIYCIITTLLTIFAALTFAFDPDFSENFSPTPFVSLIVVNLAAHLLGIRLEMKP